MVLFMDVQTTRNVILFINNDHKAELMIENAKRPETDSRRFVCMNSNKFIMQIYQLSIRFLERNKHTEDFESKVRFLDLKADCR